MATSTNLQWPSSFSPDGSRLVLVEARGVVDVGTPLSTDGDDTVEWLFDSEFAEGYAEISPDGRWIAYTSFESGRGEVYVRPFPDISDGLWQISTDGGGAPVWGPNGRELFYQRDPGNATTMMVVTISTEPTFSRGTPTTVFEGPYLSWQLGRSRPYDISPDGQRFLLIKRGEATEGTSELTVVLNWFEELKRLVPTEE